MTSRARRADILIPGAVFCVDLAFGSSFLTGRRAVLSAGVVNPVTGPRPYELEAVVLLNVFFGPRGVPPPPPFLGGVVSLTSFERTAPVSTPGRVGP